VVIDTDILIDAARSDASALEFLRRLEPDYSKSISVITEMELIVGCRNKTELRKLNGFLERFEVLQLSREISTTARDLLRAYRLSHGLLIPDALIAATCKTAGSALATKNQADFRFIKEISLLGYTTPV